MDDKIADTSIMAIPIASGDIRKVKDLTSCITQRRAVAPPGGWRVSVSIIAIIERVTAIAIVYQEGARIKLQVMAIRADIR